MSSPIEDAVGAAASSAGVRATLVGGVAAISSSASHWVEWINTGISMSLGVFGVAAVIFGVWRQRQQGVIEARREAREVDAQILLHKMHQAQMVALSRPQAQASDLGALGRGL